MNQFYGKSSNTRDKTMTEEQFEQIVDAILNGKYSWACLLILRFAGYNPLHYIPYRTYNRLIKDNTRRDLPKETKKASEDLAIGDLSSLRPLDREEVRAKGGSGRAWHCWGV
ncbi:HetP family heterocyst commitment protein [Pannus brasiliensis CCIBt3594]|uniref:HetP family heterocyst commitment protein n=1 Tax=Pannus brasiliensis CCIBt3594 TaxID=1427578 RepID=A0AAW9QRL8_9CHRO